MALREQIEQDLKSSLKAGDRVRLSSLRLLWSAIKNEEIEKKENLTDEEIVTIVQRQVKQRREAAEAYRQAARDDLAQNEEVELKILSSFLPQQLSEEEIRKIAEETLNSMPETERINFGKVMGQVMGRVKGKTDGNTVSKVVKELLA